MYELFIKAKWGERRVKMLSWYIEILIVAADFLTCLNKIHFLGLNNRENDRIRWFLTIMNKGIQKKSTKFIFSVL